jgi:hypothetical protein
MIYEISRQGPLPQEPTSIFSKLMKAGWGAYIFMIQKDASIERKY